jgi:hypothetical protein
MTTLDDLFKDQKGFWKYRGVEVGPARKNKDGVRWVANAWTGVALRAKTKQEMRRLILEAKKEHGFHYKELQAHAKKRARDWYCQDPDISDILKDLLDTDLCEHYGLTDCVVYFSLGYCQRDGVAFEGTPDLEEWRKHDEELDKKLKFIEGLLGMMRNQIHPEDGCYPNFWIKINHEGHYNWNSMNLEFVWNNPFCGECDYDTHGDHCPKWHDHVHALVGELEDYLKERIKNISRELEKTGYAELDYRQSDEYAEEGILANDYLFTEEGERA